MTLFKSLLFIICISSPLLAEEMPTSFEEAKKAAIKADKPILIDFYAVWCGPCKVFNKESKNDADVIKILESVVLFKVDAEKGTGPELAKSYGVQAYPTYALLTNKGETINKWAGYSKEHFISTLSKSLKDPVPFTEKLAAYEKNPTAPGAAWLADYYAGGGNIDKAMELYKKAESLDPTVSYAGSMFELKFMQMRQMRQRPEDKSFVELEALAEKVLTAKTPNPQQIGFVFQIMIELSKTLDKVDRVPYYVAKAYKYAETNPSPEADQIKKAVYPMYLLHVEKNPEKALSEFRTSLPAGWQDTPQGLNNFSWWCFENNIGLEEARQMAEKGVTLSPPGRGKAMMLDTLAEIENALGNPSKSFELMKQATIEDPKQSHYQQQLKRFEELAK